MKVNQTVYAFTRSVNRKFFHKFVFIAPNDLDFYNGENTFDLTEKNLKVSVLNR